MYLVSLVFHTDQTSSGAHRASYAVGTEGSFSGGKAKGRVGNYSMLSST
jgi:hypothetical protein